MTVKELRDALQSLPDDFTVRSGKDSGTAPAARVWLDRERKRIEIIDALPRAHENVYKELNYERIL